MDRITEGELPLAWAVARLTLRRWASREVIARVLCNIWFTTGLVTLAAKTRGFRRLAPRREFSEGPATTAVDAMGEAIPFK